MKRLDLFLVKSRLVRSRERAREAIGAGLVRVNGRVATKAAMRIGPEDDVVCEGETFSWVSRGALKLLAGLDEFGIAPAGRVCLDLGASTGGFTEVLLSHGAARVYAVDVGQGQLVPALANDPRVVDLPGTHAKDLTAASVPERISLLVCDVSFISLLKALPPALALCKSGADALVLIKPQFELGPRALGKKGVVRGDEAMLEAWAREDMLSALDGLGLRAKGLMTSPVRGGEGNIEFLAHLTHG